MNNLSKNLRKLRTERNLKQKEISKSIGISERAYCFYENGEREPKLDYIIKLSRYFDVSLDKLIL